MTTSVTPSTKLECSKCGLVATVCSMGLHIGPCFKGKLAKANTIRRNAATKYAKSWAAVLARTKKRVEKSLLAPPEEAIKEIGERPSPSMRFLDIPPEHPFYWDRSQCALFPREAMDHFAKFFLEYLAKVN